MIKPFQKNTLAIAVSFVFSLGAYAQSTPNIGDALKQVEPPKPSVGSATTAPKIGGVQIEPPMTALPSADKIMVTEFDVIGNRVIGKDVLQGLIANDANQSYSLADLENIAQKVTKYYRSQGYFVARAYIPAQQVENRVVKIRVVEGNYGNFHLNNKSLIRDDIVQAMLDDIKEYDIVSLDTLERAILIINDTPGAQIVRADVMPGEKVGTSDFAVESVATSRNNGYVMLDNYGTEYTGKNRLSFNYEANSPTSRGDRLSFSGLVSENNGLINGRVSYSNLLKPNGLRGELAVGNTQYSLGGAAYQGTDAKGSATSLDATLTYPVRRIRAQTLEASLNIANRELEDRFASDITPKNSKSITAGLLLRDERSLLGYDGLTQASMYVTFGDLSINSAKALDNDKAGVNTNGNYNKLVLTLTRASLLPKEFTLVASLKAQQSLDGKNLDSSERMSVSGSSSNGVAAYPAGELMGTNARLVKLELSHPLPAINRLQHSWSVFATHGFAEAAKPLSVADSGRDISDIGFGWKANYQGFMVNANLAYRLEDAEPLSEKVDRTRLMLQAGYLF